MNQASQLRWLIVTVLALALFWAMVVVFSPDPLVDCALLLLSLSVGWLILTRAALRLCQSAWRTPRWLGYLILPPVILVSLWHLADAEVRAVQAAVDNFRPSRPMFHDEWHATHRTKRHWQPNSSRLDQAGRHCWYDFGDNLIVLVPEGRQVRLRHAGVTHSEFGLGQERRFTIERARNLLVVIRADGVQRSFALLPRAADSFASDRALSLGEVWMFVVVDQQVACDEWIRSCME